MRNRDYWIVTTGSLKQDVPLIVPVSEILHSLLSRVGFVIIDRDQQTLGANANKQASTTPLRIRTLLPLMRPGCDAGHMIPLEHWMPSYIGAG